MNSLKSFVFALGACIGVPTYIMAVRPYAVERERQPVAYSSVPDPKTPAAPPKDPEALKGLYYPQAFAGDNKRGETVYIREGCAQCHTQVVRPDYAGVDQWKRFGGSEQIYKVDAPVAVRQTHPWDYMHEDFAMFGQRRIGPDLSNLHYRYVYTDKASETDPERRKMIDPAKIDRLYLYLYAPRANSPSREKQSKWTNSPSYRHLFERKTKESATGRVDALKLDGVELPEALKPGENEEIIPTDEAKDLVEYLLGLKRDAPLPAAITGAQPAAKAAQ